MTKAANLAASATNLSSTGTLGVAGINATGTPSSTTYLRGDGSWATAGASTTLYDIGTYVIGRPANTTTYAVNSTLAGSSLYATGGSLCWYGGGGVFAAAGSGNSADPGSYTLVNTGSWRCVSPGGIVQGTFYAAGLWVRYA